MKLVLIEWWDSHSSRGWRPLSDIAKDCEPLACHSVGWLLSRKNGHTTIVPHLSAKDQRNVETCGSGHLTIPNKAIRKTTKLRKR